MISKLRKKGIILTATVVAGLVSLIGGFSRNSSYSSNTENLYSPLGKTARANIPPQDTPPPDGDCSYDCAGWSDVDCQCWYCGISCGAADGGDCCAGCFPAGTLVSTPSGAKEIQDFKIGDEVSTFDPIVGNSLVSKVINTMKHSWDDVHSRSPLIIITHEKGKITLTINHPVYMRGGVTGELRDFIEAGSLKSGDQLTLEDGTESKIIGIEQGAQYDFVYNLEIEETHTYIADKVRVHNTK